MHLFLGVVSLGLTEAVRQSGLSWGPRSLGWRKEPLGEPPLGLWSTPEACGGARAPRGVTAIVRARFDDRDALEARLGMPPQSSDAELVLGAYLRWGADFAEHLRGDFAATIWDPDDSRLIAAVDPMGIGALFVTRLPTGERAFSNHLTPLRRLWGKGLRLDESVVARYISQLPIEPERTSFQGIERVAPGTTVILDTRGRRARRYWSVWDVAPIRLPSREQYVEAFRESFVRAVSRRLGTDALGIAVSAGLDSSSILCIAHQLGARDRLIPISGTPGQISCDERQGVEDLCRSQSLVPTFVSPSPTLRAFRETGEAIGEPRYLEFFPLLWSLARGLQTKGASRILTGLHGDLVSGSTRGYLPSLLRHDFPSWLEQVSRYPWSLRPRLTLSSLLRGLRLTEPPFRMTRVILRYPHWSSTEMLSNETIQRLSLREFQWRQSMDIERAEDNARFFRLHSFEQNLLAETEHFGRVLSAFGIETAHPFADRDLVALSFGLPLYILRGRDGINRYPLRAAMQGRLPDQIRLNRKKILFRAFYEDAFRQTLPELAQIPWVDELRPLLSPNISRPLALSQRWNYSQKAELWRCLAVNFWLAARQREEP